MNACISGCVPECLLGLRVTNPYHGLQVVEDGYEFMASRRLVTLFSAANYCGEFDNAGGVMVVNEKLCCSFEVLCELRVCVCVCVCARARACLILHPHKHIRCMRRRVLQIILPGSSRDD